MDAEGGTRGESSRGARLRMRRAEGWRPYRSVLDSITPSKRRGEELSSDQPGRKEEERMPPWRRRVGTAWFALDSSMAIGDDLTAEEGDEFARIVEETFSPFADEHIGPPGDVSMDREDEGSYSVDVAPQKMIIIGEREFDPDESDDILRTAHRPLQTCWNCDQPGHSAASCPQPRNQAMINARRVAFALEREAVPESAMQWWRDYRFTEKERTRRLGFVDRYIPGRISRELADAIFHIPERDPWDVEGGAEEEGELSEREMDQEAMERKKKSGEWPWLYWMFKWGYPPGYFSDKDPIPFVRERLRTMPVDGEDEGELLKIFGGDFGDPDRPNTPSTSSDNTAGLPITPARKVSPAEEGLISVSSPNGSQSGSDMSLDPDSPIQPKALLPPPPPPDFPPPPSPPSPVPTSTARLVERWTPPTGPKWQPPSEPRARPTWSPVKWASYPTHLFDSARLKVYTESRPLPLGF